MTALAPTLLAAIDALVDACRGAADDPDGGSTHFERESLVAAITAALEEARPPAFQAVPGMSSKNPAPDAAASLTGNFNTFTIGGAQPAAPSNHGGFVTRETYNTVTNRLTAALAQAEAAAEDSVTLAEFQAEVERGTWARKQAMEARAERDGARQETARLRELIALAAQEFNAIRARDGAPQHIDWYQGRPLQTSSCTHEWWSELTDRLYAALRPAEEQTR